MGVKVHVREGEPIEQALRRLRKLIRQGNRWPVYLPRADKRRQEYYQKPSVLRRQRRYFAGINRRNNLNYFSNLYAPLRRWHEQNPYA